MYLTVTQDISTQIVEKKSKFIAEIFYVQNVEEVEEKLASVKKKYFDARHHCYAYIIENKGEIIERYSDDGEPSGTAGAPMLNILSKKELKNVLIVVTRYFGGILLGTGGLVKAYSEAAKQVIGCTKFAEELEGYEIQLMISYKDYKNFNYYCYKNEIKCINIVYDDKICVNIEISKEKKDCLLKQKAEELGFEILDYSILNEKKIRKNIEI